MNISLDEDVRSVAEFMQSNISTEKLRATAEAIALLAPVIWGQYEMRRITLARLSTEPIWPDGQRTQ